MLSTTVEVKLNFCQETVEVRINCFKISSDEIFLFLFVIKTESRFLFKMQ